jgi:hypothetical protein
MTKQERHEQAVKDIEAIRYEHRIYSAFMCYEIMHDIAVSQRERVLELEEENEVLKAALGYATLDPSAETSDRQIEKWMTKARESLRSKRSHE